MRAKLMLAAFLGLSLLSAAWSDPMTSPSPYAKDDMWLCKPGQSPNRCLELNQSITYVYPDNRQVLYSHITAAAPTFDCFYLYPTVDADEKPGNTAQVSDVAASNALFNQAARFTELCNIYAPFYRQMTMGTYRLGAYRNTTFHDIAYRDVSEAFSQYLLESGNRPFVLMGHSQGAHMVLELLARRFENNPELRKRLISALVIGPLGKLRRPEAAIIPDSYANIPLCTHVRQTGCIVTFDTVAGGGAEARAADKRPCVNPTHLGGDPGVLETVIFPTAGSGFETPWVGYAGRFTANCDTDGYLAIDAPTDMTEPVPGLQLIQDVVGSNSFHVADFNWTIGDLLRVIAIQAKSMPRDGIHEE